MRNFVTTFDNENYEMRLAVNVNAPDGVGINLSQDTGLEIDPTYGLYAALLAFAMFIAYIFYC